MFGPYLEVLRRPGAARFTGAGMIARLQMTMSTFSSVVLISAVRGSYTLAGIVSALYALSAALMGPQLSRLIDLRGQRRVVSIQLAVHVLAMAGLIIVAVWTSHDWPILMLAVLAGSSQPTVGALVRTRWSTMLSGSGLLRTAFAWESLIDEAAWIIGPPLATVLAQQLFPSAALIGATTLLGIGTGLLLLQRRTEPKPSGRSSRQHGRSAILLPGMGGIFLTFVLMGGLFGSFEVATIAYAKQAGHPGSAGVMLAMFSVASIIAGLVYGVLRIRASLLRQFMWGVTAVAVVAVPLPFLGNLVLLGSGLALSGIAYSPMAITGMALVETIVPHHRLTEAMSWTTSGMAVGVGLSTPFTGWVIDAAGAQSAFWVTLGCAAGAVLVSLLVRPSVIKAGRSSSVAA